MDTGERQAVPLDDAEIKRIKALENWATDFAKTQQNIVNEVRALHDRIGTLVDVIGATDEKTTLAMAEIKALAARLDKLHGWADPQIKLEAARSLVEADAMIKAEKWRKRINAAWPFVKFVFWAGALVSAVTIMGKGGPNIWPWLTK